MQVLLAITPEHAKRVSRAQPEAVVLETRTGSILREGTQIQFTYSQKVILRELVPQRGDALVSRQDLFDAIYGNRPDGGPLNHIVSVFVCKARRKLKSIGLDIECHYNRGYRLKVCRKTSSASLRAA